MKNIITSSPWTAQIQHFKGLLTIRKSPLSFKFPTLLTHLFFLAITYSFALIGSAFHAVYSIILNIKCRFVVTLLNTASTFLLFTECSSATPHLSISAIELTIILYQSSQHSTYNYLLEIIGNLMLISYEISLGILRTMKCSHLL